jgi:hypothetical protein
MELGKLCFPGDNAAMTATVTASPQSADTRYQAANLLTSDRAYVVRSTGTSFALRFVFAGGNQEAIRVSIHNTNATTAVATNPAGLNVNIPLPGLDVDGQRLDAHLDISDESFNVDDEMTITLSVVSGIVECGNVGIWVAERDVNWEAGRDEGIQRPGNSTLETQLGSFVQDDQGIRRRWYELTFSLEEDLAIFRTLDKSSKGAVLAFPLVPDVEVNDALWVHCPEPFSAQRGAPGFARIPRRFVEISGGPPNG